MSRSEANDPGEPEAELAHSRMNAGRTVIVPGVAADTGRPTLTVLAGEAARDGYRRLALLAAVFGGAILVAFVIALLARIGLLLLTEPVFLSPREAIILASAAVLSLFVLIGSLRRLFPGRYFSRVAIAYEVAMSIVIGSLILGWQDRLGTDALTWATEGGPRPWDLGTADLPMVAVWLIFFAMLIPLRPRQHLLGAGVSALTLFAWPSISVALLGMPDELIPVQGSLVSAVTQRIVIATLIGVGMAYFAARAVYGLRRELSKARRMGSYQLKKKLGEGGMGEVWTADHQMLARSAAIKLIKSDGDPGTDPGWDSMVRRFEREVQATANLRSHHTIEIYDYGLAEDGSFYYVMELLDGLDLQQLVNRYGPLPWERATFLLRQICHSLGEAHARDLIHRDIKPANIFTCRLGREADQVKVLDFGLVTRTSPMSGDSRLTQEGSFVGTPAYAAPELATGSVETADARSDVYSLGCVAYWLLTGCYVFDVQTPVEMLIKHARDAPEPASSRTELDVPAALDALVMDCLAKDPGARPPTMDELDARMADLDSIKRWTRRDALDWWDIHQPTRREESESAGGQAAG